MSRDEPFDYRKRFSKGYQIFETMVASRPSLWRLKLRRWRRQRLYAKLIRIINKRGGPDRDGIYSDIHGNELEEMRGIEGAIDFAISVRLTDKARALDVEIPENSDGMWTGVKGNRDQLFLSSRGRAHLRKLIDAEKARRFEVKTLWVTKIILPMAGTIVGIIGALTGLIAVLRHSK